MNDHEQHIRLSKRLSEADGYIDLGMSQHALDRLEGLGDHGPFEAAVAMLRGKALWLQKRFDEAAENLRVAADGLKSPQSRQAWLAISLYHRHRHDVDNAIDALSRARGANIPPRRSQSQP